MKSMINKVVAISMIFAFVGQSVASEHSRTVARAFNKFANKEQAAVLANVPANKKQAPKAQAKKQAPKAKSAPVAVAQPGRVARVVTSAKGYVNSAYSRVTGLFSKAPVAVNPARMEPAKVQAKHAAKSAPKSAPVAGSRVVRVAKVAVPAAAVAGVVAATETGRSFVGKLGFGSMASTVKSAAVVAGSAVAAGASTLASKAYANMTVRNGFIAGGLGAAWFAGKYAYNAGLGSKIKSAVSSRFSKSTPKVEAPKKADQKAQPAKAAKKA